MCFPQGYEDWLRHKADNEVNGAPVYVVRSGGLVKTRSKNIRVKDKLKTVFLLHSSNCCFIANHCGLVWWQCWNEFCSLNLFVSFWSMFISLGGGHCQSSQRWDFPCWSGALVIWPSGRFMPRYHCKFGWRDQS